jgi:hypothetical protein
MSESQSRIEQKVDLSLVKPKNALKKSQLSQDLLVLLRVKIAEYPASHNLKCCNEFVLYACKLVENLIKKSDGINKKEFVKDIFRQLFNLTAPELQILDASIEFLWANGLICAIPISKKAVSWIQKKVSCFV